MMAVAAPAPVSNHTLVVSPSLRRLLAAIAASVPQAHLVGGAVRDLISGRRPGDLDIVTREDPRRAAEMLASALGAHVFPLDIERGQFRVVLPDGATVNEIDVSPAPDLNGDLARRDYTIDAMAASIHADGGLGEAIDLYQGEEDLAERRLRMVNAANLGDDPLRLLRGVRLAVELDLSVEQETARTIRDCAPLLQRVAGERRRDELVRIFSSPRAAAGLRLADSLRLLDVLFPELAPARGVGQPSNHHYYDVFEHSIQTVAALDEMLDGVETSTERPWLGPDFRAMSSLGLTGYLQQPTGAYKRRSLLKLAGLLHDIAKPETKKLHPDGRIRFLGHAEQGALKARRICERLRFGNRETRFVSLLVEEHLRPTQLAQPGEMPSRRALYRFFRDLGEAAPACLVLSLADGAAAAGPRLQQERWRAHAAYVRHILLEGGTLGQNPQAKKSRLLDGNDLMQELNLQPGPGLGRILSDLDEAQAIGEIKTRDQALQYARRSASAMPPSPSEQEIP